MPIETKGCNAGLNPVHQIMASIFCALPSGQTAAVVVNWAKGPRDCSTPRSRAAFTDGTITISTKPLVDCSGARPSCKARHRDVDRSDSNRPSPSSGKNGGDTKVTQVLDASVCDPSA